MMSLLKKDFKKKNKKAIDEKRIDFHYKQNNISPIINTQFKNNVSNALSLKKELNKTLKIIYDYLNSISPGDYHWYGNSLGFVKVDVLYEDVDVYIEFIESIVGCKYSQIINENGITFVINLSTLNECLSS